MGRLVLHQEFANGQAAAATHTRTAFYDRTGLITQEIVSTFTVAGSGQAAYITTATTNYSYYEGLVWRGVVTGVTTSAWVTSGPQPKSTSITYEYVWYDQARQAKITFDSDTGSNSNALNTSTFAYDLNGRLSFVNIKDGRARNVTFVTDANGQVLTRTEQDNLSSGDPRSRYWYFNDQRVGEVTNNYDWGGESRYFNAMITRTARPNPANGPFVGGSINPSPNADFDLAYEALTPNSIRSTGQAWTVRDGDTLQGIAAAVWGDASLWYLIAEHNGLTGASVLTAGQLITVPAKVANVHNNSETFRPYDPNKAMGDLSPTQPAPPKKPGGKGCGVVGQIIAVVIAVVVVAITKGAAAGPVTKLLAAAGIKSAAVATVATAATAAAAGSIASQGFLIATGAQDSFSWKQLGISVISAGVNAGLDAKGIFSGGSFTSGLARGATASVITQGVSVATGLQSSFSWTSVAVSAVIQGFDSQWGDQIGNWAFDSVGGGKLGTRVAAAARGGASALVGATARSVITGDSFGDNLIAVLPDVIGSTIGNVVATGLMERAYNARRAREEEASRSSPLTRILWTSPPTILARCSASTCISIPWPRRRSRRPMRTRAEFGRSVHCAKGGSWPTLQMTCSTKC